VLRKPTILFIGAIFLGTSGLLYVLEFLIFRDMHFLTITLFSSLAYLPLEVFIVVIMIEQSLASRDKRNLMQKLNMVVGGFYSELGTELIRNIHDYFGADEATHEHFRINANWNHIEFNNARKFAHDLRIKVKPTNTDLESLKEFLKQKRAFILSLLQNPALLEHDQFTDLLWATTHVSEELEARTSFINLPEADLKHIMFDIEQMYGHLIAQWLSYAEHLKEKYRYLFSFTVRVNPFLNKPSAIIE
jgi:hypothetical protein